VSQASQTVEIASQAQFYQKLIGWILSEIDWLDQAAKL
jgi:hypothetical protein